MEPHPEEAKHGVVEQGGKRNFFVISMFVMVILLLLNVGTFLYFNSKIKKLESNDEARLSQKNMTPEEESARNAFADSMNYRLVANCDSFMDTVSNSDDKAKDKWSERCHKEKSGETPPISDITINRFSMRDNKAFIQANITRAIDLGENITYTATYEMAMQDGNWKLLGPQE